MKHERRENMFCSNCGKEISSGVRFCPNCGAKVDVNSEAEKEKSVHVQPIQYNSEESTDASVGSGHIDSAQEYQYSANNKEGSVKEKKKSRKWIVVLVAVVAGIALIVSVALNSGDDASTGSEYHVVKTEYEEQVSLVRDAVPDLRFPQLSYGEVFAEYFGDPVWGYEKSDNGLDIVTFNGIVILDDTQKKIEFQFAMDIENGVVFEPGNYEYTLVFVEGEIPGGADYAEDLIEMAVESFAERHELKPEEVSERSDNSASGENKIQVTVTDVTDSLYEGNDNEYTFQMKGTDNAEILFYQTKDPENLLYYGQLTETAEDNDGSLWMYFSAGNPKEINDVILCFGFKTLIGTGDVYVQDGWYGDDLDFTGNYSYKSSITEDSFQKIVSQYKNIQKTNDEQLNEFITLINSFSDPPDLSEDELETYYEREYESWKRKEGYLNITEDASGHLQIEDHSSEFCGGWSDTYSQRCGMSISSADGVYYTIEIQWSGSAWESTEWEFTATYDGYDNGLRYSGSKCNYTFPEDENGAAIEEYDYYDGEGFIYIDSSGLLHWDDYVENAGENCLFEKDVY